MCLATGLISISGAAKTLIYCWLCSEKAVRAHIKTMKTGGTWNKENIMSLCWLHHIEQHTLGVVTFVQKYPIVKQKVEERGWRVVDIFGQQKLVRWQS